jgi:2-hydroxy-3-keto-5-methylthiopentenyl-1-phosphate phosphatase
MADPSSRATAPFHVFLDFDGTLVEPNVAILVVEEFAPRGRELARSIDLALKAQQLTLREAWAQEAAALPAARLPEMQEFIRRKAPLRAGASEFLALLREFQVRTTLLSGGLDIFIQPVLEREGLDLHVLSESAAPAPGGGLEVSYPHGHPTCRLCGICKANVVGGNGSDLRTVFVGDGSTDRYGAEVADIVFARHRLLEFCRQSSIPCYPFEDFGPVIERFEGWLRRGEPVPAPRQRGQATSPCPISKSLATAGA